MPPWAGSSVLGKEVWECFNLPTLPGMKFFKHYLWQSYENQHPGIGKKDPVLAVLQKYEKLESMKARIDKILPFSPKMYFNTLLQGQVNIDPHSKKAQEGTYKELAEPEPRRVGTSLHIYSAMMTHITAAEKSSGGSIVTNPYAVGLIGIAKVNDGKKIRYDVEIIGSTTPTGTIPTRYDLVEKYGENAVATWYNNIPNLDEQFPAPTEADMVETGIKAKALDEILRREASNKTEKDEEKEQAKKVGAKPGPGGSVTNQDPNLADRRIREQKAGADLPAPETQQQAPLPSPKDIKTRDLGLEAAPMKGDRPMCFTKFPFVQASPNKAWCDGCEWKNACKMMSNGGKA